MRAAFCVAAAAALVAEHPAAACTMPPGVSAREFNRARLADIRNAPIVVEGYVVVRKAQAGETRSLPVARLIPRRIYKGPQNSTYPLNYYPTTCHVPFPLNRAKRQKVYLVGGNGSFIIIHVEPLK